METRRVKPADKRQYGYDDGQRPPKRHQKVTEPKSSPGWRFWMVAGALLAMATWLYLSFKVNSVEVRGVRHLTYSHMESITYKAIRSNFLDTNLLTLSSGRVGDKIESLEPLAASTSLKRRWPHGVIVQVAETDLGLIWETVGQRYLSDSKGIIVAKIKQAPAGLSLITVNDQANVPVEVGDRVAPSRFITFINQLPQSIKAKTGINIKGYSIPESISEIHITSESGYVIKFDTTRGAEEQAEALRVVMSELTRLGRKPAEYIDLRIAGKAYYKLLLSPCLAFIR